MNNVAHVDRRSQMIANQNSVTSLLEKMKGEIARCLPKHLTPERMTRIAITQLRTNSKLQECDPLSFIASIFQASQLGLEPGILGSCYLVPFRNTTTGKLECTFMPGYRGFLDLARRSGCIESLVARAVYSNDEFSYEFGLKESLVHRPAMQDRGELVAVYAVAMLKDGGHQFDVMSKKDVDMIRAQSKSKNNGPWVTHYEEMAKKTVLRKLFKWLPCSVEMQKAVSLDELEEAGIQNIKAAASEEFDIDFIGENEETLCLENDSNAQNTEAPVTHAEKNHEVLMNKLKSAKSVTDEPKPLETGEGITGQQLAKINELVAIKEFPQARFTGVLKHYGVEIMEQLTTIQADNFISLLNKEADK